MNMDVTVASTPGNGVFWAPACGRSYPPCAQRCDEERRLATTPNSICRERIILPLSDTQRVVRRGHGLPGAGVESPSLEGFQNRLDVALGDVVWQRGGVGLAVGLEDLRGLFQPEWFCDLMILSDAGHEGHRTQRGPGTGDTGTRGVRHK